MPLSEADAAEALALLLGTLVRRALWQVAAQLPPEAAAAAAAALLKARA